MTQSSRRIQSRVERGVTTVKSFLKVCAPITINDLEYVDKQKRLKMDMAFLSACMNRTLSIFSLTRNSKAVYSLYYVAKSSITIVSLISIASKVLSPFEIPVEINMLSAWLFWLVRLTQWSGAASKEIVGVGGRREGGAGGRWVSEGRNGIWVAQTHF